MSRLFGRQVIVEIGIPGEPARRFVDLRISGRVDKTPKSGPNTATVEIYNPAEASIAVAQDRRAVVRILAGHDVARLLFVGTIIRNGAKTERAGPDRVLTIEALDGGRAYQEAHISETFKKSTTSEQLFAALAARMGLQLTFGAKTAARSYERGITLVGPVRGVLDDISASIGAEWSIQDGTLQILDAGDVTAEEVVRASSRTGNLIGAPKRGSDGIEITTLLDGRFRPGRRFVLESEQFNGIFKAREVRHVFDSGFDSAFHTIIVGKEF